MYIYNRAEWPQFTWDSEKINELLMPLKYEQGRLLGKMENLGFGLREYAVLETLTHEVIKTSEIEGEHLRSDEVRSSIARHLGIDAGGMLPASRHVDGIVEVLLDATQNYQKPLTELRLCQWHAMLFPSSLSGMQLITPGHFRTDAGGPMQVVSGSYGREKVHFRAPPANQLAYEVPQFLAWFNSTNLPIDPIIKAAIAHLWFVTLHPFDDGNGRITRAITDMALAQAEKQSARFYSMSTQIRKQRRSYYQILESSQKGGLDITAWLVWYLQCMQEAILASGSILNHVLNKAKFWEAHAHTVLNPRQIDMLNALFDGFKGKLTSSKWAKMTKCSQDTANRDIRQLLNLKILCKSTAGGRSTSYELVGYPINEIS